MVLKDVIKSVLAGILITIGCTIYISIINLDSSIIGKFIGALLFSIALLTICIRKYNLFTGKVGYLATSKDITFKSIFIILLGNILGVLLTGLLIRASLPNMINACKNIINIKLTQSIWECFGRSFFCGILMYLAVDSYKNYNAPNYIMIIICVVTFILCGFEHSIANLGYFVISGKIDFIYIVICILGNAVGGNFLSILENVQ